MHEKPPSGAAFLLRRRTVSWPRRLRHKEFFSIVGSEGGSKNAMTKSELIERLAARHPQFMLKDVELAVKLVLDQISDSLAQQDRVEIRGFGSFSLHRRPAMQRK